MSKFRSYKFKGIGASSGISIAKVFKLTEQKIEISDAKITDIDAEIKIFQDGVQKSVEQIEKIKKLATKLNQDELEILDAHILIATDPVLEDDTINMIKSGYSAAYSLKETAKNHTNFLLETGDEYLMGRAVDIKDASQRIIKNILNLEIIDLSAIDEDVIIVADDLKPSDTAQLNEYVKGFATNIGSKTSHSAIMARSLEIPAILGIGDILEKAEAGDILAINGDLGQGILNPSETEIKEFEILKQEYENEKAKLQDYLNKESKSADGKKVVIAANIGSVDDSYAAKKVNADEIGLFRSEFLYMDNQNWPTEDEQFFSYKAVLETQNPKKVVVRTLDIGGDKTLKYFDFAKEMNPFLGYRAIRLSLDKTDIFKTQLRALVRASEFGNLAIMFPMVATLDEFFAAKAIFEQVYQEVSQENPKVAKREDIKIGIMIEIPISAIHADQFAKYVDFFSIGTNDLIQYSFAADRMNEKVAYLYQTLNPGLLKLIKMAIDAAHKHGKWIGMCGEMAGDINAVPLLLGLGLDEFSVSTSSVLKVKKLISDLNYEQMVKIANEALQFDTEGEVVKYLESLNLIRHK
ncbi:phosphoenolpyruvate--protein phosphotransferase [Mesomycoplasma ovipneumoniae]|uniref:phosphoenolpyruvate--protein phosphotransferase n=1 Tax=Mesomycoplasma ovipneumoniae TaxID=29562 RepID=UPI00296543D0|nr:phosphoenolpyruvate--protein phosphotransferase [Mesomycoplasma ovipneumoniae]MDW2923335.1 phosphoenolpyruvate--protein phosphotransferase [Mesomycoplasma ovipneumoniae]